MPWNEQDYPNTWKNFDEMTRRKAIDIANEMLADGYKDEDAIPIATAQAKKWMEDATDADKDAFAKKDITQHDRDKSNKRPEYIEKDVHVQYDHEDQEWEVKTEGAKQPSQTFDTKKEAKDRAKEIADNRDTDVISHTKSETKPAE